MCVLRDRSRFLHLLGFIMHGTSWSGHPVLVEVWFSFALSLRWILNFRTLSLLIWHFCGFNKIPRYLPSSSNSAGFRLQTLPQLQCTATEILEQLFLPGSLASLKHAQFRKEQRIWEFICRYKGFLHWGSLLSRICLFNFRLLWQPQLHPVIPPQAHKTWWSVWVLVTPLLHGELTGSKRISSGWIPSFKGLIPSSFCQFLVTFQDLWVVFLKNFYPKLIIVYGWASQIQPKESLNTLLKSTKMFKIEESRILPRTKEMINQYLFMYTLLDLVC